MNIREIFEKDITRKINGVVKVGQSDEAIIRQEVEEYIVTNELKKHFLNFFQYYSKSFSTPPPNDIGVWISGFFGSGKSHFLKILSYLLENRPVANSSVVEFFEKKFDDDPESFRLIRSSIIGHKTETILFNIDAEGPTNATDNKSVVLEVFAKMFYNHLGYFGRNPKVVTLEKLIEQESKTAEFKQAIEVKTGRPWEKVRELLDFFIDPIAEVIAQVREMSKQSAINALQTIQNSFSINDLVADITEYTDKQDNDFRLLFMVDEVGQYIGADTNRLLNLQSLVEEIGSKCAGKVWVACTGQEAIDDVIKVNSDAFSKIQARFKTQLLLSSSSVGEVIQRRLLSKTPKAKERLGEIYDANEISLGNLFSFDKAKKDIGGYKSKTDFIADYPFVPYQFTIMPKIFAEIRKHGHSGKHLAGGERSMLSGFQEVVTKKIIDKNDKTLVPLFQFYDTVHSFLDSTIRNVIERCDKAANAHEGIQPQDVDVLKMLYLIRYLTDEFPATIDNLVILMADSIDVDKAEKRNQIQKSLDRLFAQNYIGKDDHEGYNFLTDEEQDIEREIKNTKISPADVIQRMGEIIFDDIYASKKYAYNEVYNFQFDRIVDETAIGQTTCEIQLQLLTEASDQSKREDFSLMTETSRKGLAIGVLPTELKYYELLENAVKIRQYIKQRNRSGDSDKATEIINGKARKADLYEEKSREFLKKAIQEAKFWVAGRLLPLKSGDAKSKIDQTLEYLVQSVYNKLSCIDKNIKDDSEITKILTGSEASTMGIGSNCDAAKEVEKFIRLQDEMKKTISMADIQQKFQVAPYGWREIDIAAVVASLLREAKVIVKSGGGKILLDFPKLPDMLRKKNETSKTIIALKLGISPQKIRELKAFLTEYFDRMAIPEKEDDIVTFIDDKFTSQRNCYEKLNSRYEYNNNNKYPGQEYVKRAIELINNVLGQKKDNNALIDYILEKRESLRDSKDQVAQVKSFFDNQVKIFDRAIKMINERKHEMEDYFNPHEQEAYKDFESIKRICFANPFDYDRIPKLNKLMETVSEGHERLLKEKQKGLSELIDQCREMIHGDANAETMKEIIKESDDFYKRKKASIAEISGLAQLDGQRTVISSYKDSIIDKIKAAAKSTAQTNKPTPSTKPSSPKVYKKLNRSVVFNQTRINSKEDIDKYVEEIKNKLTQWLAESGGIELT